MKEKIVDIIEPINQLTLYGYKKYFDLLRNLFDKNKLPNCILLSGQKGIGKSTFAYHFINSLLSKDEKYEYLLNEYKINDNNYSYNQIINETHFNFFRISSSTPNAQIKIEQSRNLIKFLNKTTYKQNFKIVLIEDIENFNVNASNAILKSLEEPSANTFFFLIHNNSCKILETILSRCMIFKIHFSESEKKEIFDNIISNHYPDLLNTESNHNLYFNSPGCLLHQSLLIKNSNFENRKSILSLINLFLDKFSETKNVQILNYASFYIEKFYTDMYNSNTKILNISLNNYNRILNQINLIKKFNLNEKNSFIWIKDILQNETR